VRHGLFFTKLNLSRVFSIGGTALFGGAVFGLSLLGGTAAYGWALFVVLPFAMGFMAAWLHSFREPRGLEECQAVAGGASLVLALGVLLVAMEGLLCILMATPLWFIMTVVGAASGFEATCRKHRRRTQSSVFLFFALAGTPLLMEAEYLVRPAAPVFPVQTAVEIAAPPEEVWKHVVSFPKLPEPEEWIFRLGIAYPVGASIQHGVRSCEFSTGTFEEPITDWDPPRLLRFDVSSNPPSMRELSFYKDVNPPHLHGYFISRKGQFKLEPLPGGHTRLEGTTWYAHHMGPATYWRLWSDWIIHKIHRRVLRHIKTLAEESTPPTGVRLGLPWTPTPTLKGR
jgi:Polyketide cyclase / dehydrase and lipid transport